MATARKLPSGNWRVRVYSHTDVNGKKIYTSITAPTKKEAEIQASLYDAKNNSSYYNMSFLEAGNQYIDAKQNTWSPNTVRSYRILQKRLEILNTYKLSKIDSVAVQREINRLSAVLSPKSVRSTYGFVTAVMRMFQPGTVLRVNLPEKRPSETKIPTDDEVAMLISNAHSDDLRLAIKLAAFGSMRSGEICALRNDCVFRDHISVKRAYALHENGVWAVKESPKTAAGFRDIPLPGDIMDDIKNNIKDDGSIVHYTPSSLHDAFRRLTKSCDMYPYKFHSLRHYFASLCHAQGIPDKYIMQIGGWDDVSTLTKIYQHTTPDKMDDVADIINDYYKSMTRNMTREKEIPAK